MLAPATDTFGTPLWPHAGRVVPPTFLRSIMPALDLAFGLPYSGDAPDALTALILKLEAAPFGGQPSDSDEAASPPADSVERTPEHSLG